MADDEASHSLQEWNGTFKKSLGKLSADCYRSFLLDIATILLGLKPSLLFDYAVVDSKKAHSLMRGFAANGLFPRSLNVLKVGEDIFFADLNLLINYLRKSLESEEFTLIDVSGNLQEPRVLDKEIAVRVVKEQFNKIVEIFQQKLNDLTPNSVQKDEMSPNTQVVDLGSYSDVNCCIPSVFGLLLGYPVIYWFDEASENNCLSLVPLNRYTVTFKASPSILHPRMAQSLYRLVAAGCCKSQISPDHTLFSFTAPVALECYYESKVSDWAKRISGVGEKLGISEHLTFKKTTVTFAQVTL